MKLSEELKAEYTLDPMWLNKNVNIPGGPMIDLETVDLATVNTWHKAGKLGMLKPAKKTGSTIPATT